MRCSACGEALEPSAFPGALVRCASCGAELRVPDYVPIAALADGGPYRQAAPVPPPEPEAELGPTSEDMLRLGGPCPQCAGALLEPRYDDFTCPRCEGLFVTHDRLQALVHDHREAGLRPVVDPAALPVVSDASVRYLPCPSCSARMNRRNFGDRSGIVVDVCKRHGVWFDHGELEAVIAYAYDLPEDAGARAALLALVKRELPPPTRQPPLPYELDIHGARQRRFEHQLDTVDQLTSWLGALFRSRA